MKGLKHVKRKGKKKTVVKVGKVSVGRKLAIIAGPCSIENEETVVRRKLLVIR